MTTLQIKTPKWFEPLLAPGMRYCGAYGGRGSGKSHAFGEALIERHIMDQDIRSVGVREVQKSIDQSVKRLLELKIQSMNAGAYFEVQDKIIKSKNGDGMIIFQGMQNHTADSIKSLEAYKILWMEEAQSISQKSLDLIRPTMRNDAEIWATWNPDEPTDPIDQLLRGPMLPPRAVVVEVNHMDNPWFPPDLQEEMEYDKSRDPDKYAHIWLGQYVQRSEARVFNNWAIEDFDAPADAIHRFGADWGFAVDPTVLVRCHIIGRKLYIDYEAYKIGCEITETPTLFGSVPESDKWAIRADSSRPETISHMKKNGYPKIHSAIKGPGSVEDGIEWLKSFDIVVHPRCRHTIDELSTYKYKIDSKTDQVLPVMADANNHVIDALRYACEEARRADKRVIHNFVPSPTKHHWSR